MNTTNKPATMYWKSVTQREELAKATSKEQENPSVEAPSQSDEVAIRDLVTIQTGTASAKEALGRRSFMGIFGASTAFAGLASGCIRKPVEHILPFAKRPEDVIPGKPMYYATAYQVGPSVQGLVVESQDGRPTKIEGNPDHENSQGATDAWAQGSVLLLYDEDRSQTPQKREGEQWAALDWQTVQEQLGEIIAVHRQQQGRGLGLVLPVVLSPTMREQLDNFRIKMPEARLFLSDVTATTNSSKAAELLTGQPARVHYQLLGAQVLLACDCDFLGTEPDHVRLAQEFAAGRRVAAPGDDMSRLYAVEPNFSITGAQADHRVAVPAQEVGRFLQGLAHELASKHQLSIDSNLVSASAPELPANMKRFVEVLAKDLVAAKNRDGSAILVGTRQPTWVHGLALVLNDALGNLKRHVQIVPVDPKEQRESINALAKSLAAGELETLICLDTNPVYDAPGELGFARLLGQVKHLIHAGYYRAETGQLAHWHLPLSHYLETWGDLVDSQGVVSICQPLIAPLFDTRSAIELLAWFASGVEIDSYSLVQSYWRTKLGARFSEKAWRKWLHQGVAREVSTPHPSLAIASPAAIKAEMPAQIAPLQGIEINYHLDPKVIDGRMANNPWMQELPHPMTKLTWDNAAYIAPKMAAELGVSNCDLLTLEVEGRSVTLPVWIAPGQAEQTVSVSLGYGRYQLGQFAKDAGVDVYPLQSARNPWFVGGASVRKAGGQRLIYSTQDHDTLDPGMGYPLRPIVRETTVAGFASNPDFAQEGDLMEPGQLRSLWQHNDPNNQFGEPLFKGKQQWAMVIDLNTCTGCNACVVACQAENNIPVVGREQVANGREMHWIRIDRYYSGDPEDPQAVVQPMLCQHCETAPCESVCPVAATVHSPEGLNDMVYNRCVGTRYCANNCPYKVRRFNFFNYNKRMDETMGSLLYMVRNPDVTVRFRGVIEKCTYCVQRINNAKIEAHVQGQDVVRDGVIQTACQQVCPAKAITFGDKNDNTSQVAKLRQSKRNYGVLTDLNTRPRTTYLGRVRNPHPELV